MASPMKVDEGRLRGQGEAGKKRSADAKASDVPRKVSLPSATTVIPGSIPRGAVALDPYRFVGCECECELTTEATCLYLAPFTMQIVH